MSIVARSQYDERGEMVSDLSFVGKKSRTKQADARDCDINLIMKRFEKTGQLPDMIVRNPAYGDFSNAPDYQEALHIVRHAEEQFSNLDAPVRNRFSNDPVKFLEFANDPANVDELDKMGLLNESAKAALKAKKEAEGAISRAEADLKVQADERALIDRIKAELGK